MTLRRLRWILILYATCDFLIGYAGVIPITNLAAAQFTTVTGTVTDPNGLPYAFGTIVPTLLTSASPTLNGLAYTPPTQPTGLSSSGSFTMQLADNTVLLPAATKWNFLVCSAVGTVLPAGGKGPICFSLAAPITISGSSQDISGNLNSASVSLTSAPVIATSGVGFFFGASFYTPLAAAIAGDSQVANRVYFYQMVLPIAAAINKVSVNVSASAAATHVNVALYNAAGSKVLDSGAFDTSGTGAKTNTLASRVILPAGSYYYAWSFDNNSGTLALFCLNNQYANPTTASDTLLNANSQKRGQASNSLSAGVMPATLGTLSADTFSFPVLALFEP